MFYSCAKLSMYLCKNHFPVWWPVSPEDVPSVSLCLPGMPWHAATLVPAGLWEEETHVRSDLGPSPRCHLLAWVSYLASQPFCSCVSKTESSQGSQAKTAKPPGPRDLLHAPATTGWLLDGILPIVGTPDSQICTPPGSGWNSQRTTWRTGSSCANRKSTLQRGWLVEEYVETQVRIPTPCLVGDVPAGMLPSLDGGLGVRVALLEGCWGVP